jgi:hypothetical protein
MEYPLGRASAPAKFGHTTTTTYKVTSDSSPHSRYSGASIREGRQVRVIEIDNRNRPAVVTTPAYRLVGGGPEEPRPGQQAERPSELATLRYPELKRTKYYEPVRRHDSMDDDYGDDGYEYTNPRGLVEYDLNRSADITVTSKTHKARIEQDLVRGGGPGSVLGYNDRVESYDRSRERGPPPSTRGFDRIPGGRRWEKPEPKELLRTPAQSEAIGQPRRDESAAIPVEDQPQVLQVSMPDLEESKGTVSDVTPQMKPTANAKDETLQDGKNTAATEKAVDQDYLRSGSKIALGSNQRIVDLDALFSGSLDAEDVDKEQSGCDDENKIEDDDAGLRRFVSLRAPPSPIIEEDGVRQVTLVAANLPLGEDVEPWRHRSKISEAFVPTSSGTGPRPPILINRTEKGVFTLGEPWKSVILLDEALPRSTTSATTSSFDPTLRLEDPKAGAADQQIHRQLNLRLPYLH